MGYSIWDRANGGPANRTRYVTHFRAAKQCERLNAKEFSKNGNAGGDRYYVKEL